MRILVMLAALVAASATAAAQKSNPAVGPCAGADAALDSATRASLVAKPDRKPRRQDNGITPVATDLHFRMLTQTDMDQNFESGAARKWVIVTGIVDTTGHIDPKTAAIKESSSVGLSHAVCDAWVKMAFAPATLHGQKVPAMYQERFIFEQSVTDIGNNPNGNGGDRDAVRH